jgi:hypothetical protein
MRNIKLTENDITFVHYVLKYYAHAYPNLDSDDREEIYKVANKFK